jgi:hypothetical protein
VKNKLVTMLAVPRYRYEDNVKMVLKKEDGRVWTRLIGIRTGAHC